jgi:hypothetical protein
MSVTELVMPAMGVIGFILLGRDTKGILCRLYH